MLARFKKLLLEIQDMILIDQKKILEQTLADWMGASGQQEVQYEQVDDILVMGIRIQ
ncbi:hypothetical protein ACFLT1_08170 [Bacteroidota bacterium]